MLFLVVINRVIGPINLIIRAFTLPVVAGEQPYDE